jgi:hypothetical protein
MLRKEKAFSRVRLLPALVVIMLVAVAALGSAPVSVAAPVLPAPLSLVGPVEKICQLNGERDWASGQFTAARTMTNAGLDAGDLGYPVEHDGKLIVLFGDSWPAHHPGGAAGEIPPDDALGITTRTQAPDTTGCIGLAIQTSTPRTFARATVTGPTRIHQGFFNVPSGGVSVAGRLYAFFWTDHCGNPAQLMPSPDAPLAPVAPSAACPETAGRSSIGRSVLAESRDDGLTFTLSTADGRPVSMPIGFVYVTAVDTTTIPDLPAEQRLGVLIFGVPRYRASIPYLAYAPVASFADPSTWKFFTGVAHGQPTWVSAGEWSGQGGADWAPTAQAELFTPIHPWGRCVGEFSVTWNRPLRSWLMMYNCDHVGILARVARAPWGPWSSPTVMISRLSPGVQCTLIMRPTRCGDQRNYWPVNPDGSFVEGGFYAPFVLDRFTQDAGADGFAHKATIFWTLSTWNPYVVVIMRSTIEATSAQSSPEPSMHPLPSPHPLPAGSDHPL